MVEQVDPSPRRSVGPGPCLGLLALLLVVWYPLSFALTASSALERLISYGGPAMLLLALRVGVTGLGIAAGRALWGLGPHARRLTLWFLALASLAMLLTAVTPYFPSNRTRAGKRLAVSAILLHNAAWAVVVARSRRLEDLSPVSSAVRADR